jgi:uncharacterized protein
MYAQSVPFLLKNLSSMTKILKKAEAFCDTRKLDKSVVLGLRTYPDMLPLTAQILILCDQAKGCAARLSGTEIPKYADDEKTFEELYARIAKTADFIKSIDAKKFDGAATRTVTLKVGGKDVELSGNDYLNGAVWPNHYFHMATAHNLLRGIGVEIGKGDFLGRN